MAKSLPRSATLLLAAVKRRVSGRVAGIVSLAGLLLAQTHPTNAQTNNTTIKISFVVREDVIFPRLMPAHNVGFSAVVTLSGQNTVSERWDAQSAYGAYSDWYDHESSLGGVWRVVNAHEIRATWTNSNRVKSLLIRVSGKTCSISYQMRLQPGQTMFLHTSNGREVGATHVSILDTKCEIE